MGAGLQRVIAAVGLLVTLLCAALTLWSPLMLQQARESVFDSYQRVSPRPFDPGLPVHIIDIDEASLLALGQWPWPRSYLAALTERAFEAGAVVLGFDVLFAEPDRTGPQALAESWARFGGAALRLPDGLPDPDAQFAEAITDVPVVLGIAGGGSAQPPAPKSGVAFTGQSPDGLVRYDGATGPLPGLMETSAGLGTLTQGVDAGASGVTRSVPMVSEMAGTLYPSLTAEMLRLAQGAGGHVVMTTEGSGQVSGGTARTVAMRTGGAVYPLDGQGRFRIHFAGAQSARVTPALDLLQAQPDRAALQDRLGGKLVLVGASAQSLFDLRATPLAPVVPAVEFHAEVLEQILSGHFLTRPDWAPGLETVLAVLAGLAVTGLCLWVRPLPGLALWAAGMAGLGLSGWYAFQAQGLLLDPLPAMVTAALVFLPLTVLGLAGRERARARIRARFAYFLPETVMDQLVADPEATLSPKGEEREITVIFVDMQGFTGLTEKMAPPEVVRLLNHYLEALGATLVASGATIDKFIGDAVMAFWNAPVHLPDHRGAALRALPDLNAAIEAANADLVRMGLPPVAIRVGLNTGPAYVGLLGSARRLNYSVIGDSVTVAARMEALTRAYGVRILVGEGDFDGLPDGFVAVPLDRVRVKGREGRLLIHTILPAGPATERFRDLVDPIRGALDQKDPAAARRHLAALSQHEMSAVDMAQLAERYARRADDLQT